MTGARTYFLNEAHELSRMEASGGGSPPRLAPVDWAMKGSVLNRYLRQVKLKLDSSSDPVRDHRFYLMAVPEDSIRKESKDKKKAPNGVFDEPISYAGAHSRMLNRLGVDLIDVLPSGDALVHVSRPAFERLEGISTRLETLGKLDQSRWAAVRAFEMIPSTAKVDRKWFSSLARRGAIDVIVELQPLLGRREADAVVRAVLEQLAGKNGEERLKAVGSDFSGRTWLRCGLNQSTIQRLAERFFSIQSIHAPFTSIIDAQKSKQRKQLPASLKVTTKPVPADMPSVGVLDTGVPMEHQYLAPYRRGTFVHPDCLTEPAGSHGSFVASRVVYGDIDISPGFHDEALNAAFQYLDVRVAKDLRHVESKAVVSAIQQAARAYPDVRVFNLSFSDHKPLLACDDGERRQKLILTQDLDNLIFAADIIVVVAAGNTEAGQVPRDPYPQHYEDRDWALGHWACSYNSVVCGSIVARPVPGGITQHPGAPSPFCRVGPGANLTKVPNLAASGGDVNSAYHESSGLGVYGCDDQGFWEDHSGTSFAAPLVAREFASALQKLRTVSPQGSQPFAALAKAYLVLTAALPSLPPQYANLASRTLGHGIPSAEGLFAPGPNDAVLVWQGKLASQKDIVRFQVPIPPEWVAKATAPILEVCVAADAPVNAAVEEVYASRHVGIHVRPAPDERAATPVHGEKVVEGYPLYRREYDLRRIITRLVERGTEVAELWTVEVFYEQIAEYYVGLDFTPEQRVGIALRLVDRGSPSASPQAFLQKMPITQSMVRLSSIEASVRLPVIVR